MEDSDIINTLESYKKLCDDRSSHSQLLKDKTIILYAATLLHDKNEEIIKRCLDIFLALVNNEASHSVLLNTFGIFEAVESLSIRLRTSNEKLSQYASDIVNRLRDNAPPAYRTRFRVKNKQSYRKETFMYLLYVEDLDEYNKKLFNETLVHTKGIISFVVDMDRKRCTIRIGPKVNIKSVVSRIESACGMKTLLISRNMSNDTEEYLDVLSNASIENAEYFPEIDSPAKGKSLTTMSALKKNAGGWLKSAVDTWNKSFYW